MLLQIVTFTGNVAGNFDSVGKTYSGDLSKDVYKRQCQDNAVLNLAVSDLPRRKQRLQLLFHCHSSFAFSLAYPITQSYNLSLIHIYKCDMVDDPELIELVEMEVTEPVSYTHLRERRGNSAG